MHYTLLTLLVDDLTECVSHLYSFELIISDFNRSVFEQRLKTIKLKSFCVKLENAEKGNQYIFRRNMKSYNY